MYNLKVRELLSFGPLTTTPIAPQERTANTYNIHKSLNGKKSINPLSLFFCEI